MATCKLYSKFLESFLIAEGKQLDVFTSNEDTL